MTGAHGRSTLEVRKTSATFTMDPESTKADFRSSAELFGELQAAALRLVALDAQRRDAEDDSPPTLAADVSELCRAVLDTLSELEQAVTHSGNETFADEEQQTWVGVRPARAEPARLEDVCFVAGFELTRALKALAEAGDAEASAIASESALRKLRRVLKAVFESGSRSGASPLDAALLFPRLGAELSSALSVRQLYARFRHSLRRPENDSREAVLTALRYAAGGLAVISASPHYRAVRVSDRALLRRQRDRLLDWAHAGKPTLAGVQLLEDLFTCADLLRDINRRQELRAHDVELIRELVGDAERGRADWLVKLDRLAGLDDKLDDLTAELRSSPDLGPIIDIIVRLSFLVG
jgi:hypothetical protein